MEEITIYVSEEIESIEDLQHTFICYDGPEDRCICKKCYKYIITIDEIGEIKAERNE